MPIPNPPVAANSLTISALDLITAAMQEIGANAPGEPVSPEDMTSVLKKLQMLIDGYNARRPMIFNVDFKEFTLPVNTQPVTIGPGTSNPPANFQVIQRPIEILSATLILNGGTDGPQQVEVPLMIRDDDWWAQQSIKNLTSTLPTDLYYSPSWPNGQLYFWPIPTAVNNVRLELRSILVEVTNYNQAFTLPPGYWSLVVYDLADSIANLFERPSSPDLQRRLLAARKAVESNNITSPRMASDSPSQKSTQRSRPDFNFLTGMPQ